MAQKAFRIFLGAGVMLALAAPPLLAEGLEDIPTETLEAIYLGCERSAQTGSLAVGDVALCSVAYETLKIRLFGGDFAALLRWYRARNATEVPSS